MGRVYHRYHPNPSRFSGEVATLSPLFALTYLRRQFAVRKKLWSIELPADLTKLGAIPQTTKVDAMRRCFELWLSFSVF